MAADPPIWTCRARPGTSSASASARRPPCVLVTDLRGREIQHVIVPTAGRGRGRERRAMAGRPDRAGRKSAEGPLRQIVAAVPGRVRDGTEIFGPAESMEDLRGLGPPASRRGHGRRPRAPRQRRQRVLARNPHRGRHHQERRSLQRQHHPELRQLHGSRARPGAYARLRRHRRALLRSRRRDPRRAAEHQQVSSGSLANGDSTWSASKTSGWNRTTRPRTPRWWRRSPRRS